MNRPDVGRNLARLFRAALPPTVRREVLEALYDPRRPDLALKHATLRHLVTRPARNPGGTETTTSTEMAQRVLDRPSDAPLVGDTIATSSVASPAMQHVAPMLGFRGVFHRPSLRQAAGADAFFQWGARPAFDKVRTAALARGLGKPLLHCEDGVLLRSVELGLSGAACLALYVDDTTAYYDASRPSRLQRLLDSDKQWTEAQLSRARTCMDEVEARRVSKYNHAPDHRTRYGPGSTPKVLLVDQRRDDASVSFGLASARDFRRMLRFAARHWPRHHLLLKRHPDQISAGRQGYFDAECLEALGPDRQRTTVISEEVNPHTLFDQVEAVCVVTSGMGFEALLRGLPVHCFGTPFYSGWGASLDHSARPAPRRRRRSAEEIFHAIALDSQLYFDPVRQRTLAFEEHLSRVSDAVVRLAR